MVCVELLPDNKDKSHPAWSVVPTTIAIDEGNGNISRKITKIIPYGDGGFAMVAPYHGHRRGYLMLHEVMCGGVHSINGLGIVREYTIDDHIKLSLHPDGFVQFSSVKEKIVSGRDPQTGKPKGLGIVSAPFSTPIESGPTCGLSVWGIREFETLRNLRTKERTLVIDHRSFEYQGSTHKGWNGYMVGIFLLRSAYWPLVWRFYGELWAKVHHPRFGGHGAVLPMRVIPLHSADVVIGVMAQRIWTEFPASSGFVMGGPSERVLDPRVTAAHRSISAIYPADMNCWTGPSLRYDPAHQ